MFRCPDCRTRRKDIGLFTRHLQTTGHRPCDCGGYHHRHRPGSPMCIQNPLGALHDASRRGADDADLVRAARFIIEETPSAAAEVRELLTTWGIHGIV